jgi:hypothetical protein
VVLKDSTLRDPHGYIISSSQPDFSTAIKFINALIRSGVQVHKAGAEFTVAGKTYPAVSYIVKTAQAFRPHVLDMFEPQDHPNDFQYPGGPPIRPYDAAGWTLAYEMGVKFDRILNIFDGPFQPIPYGEIQLPKGNVNTSAARAGYLLDGRVNNAFIAVNDLLKSGVNVYRLSGDATNKTATGTFFIPSGSKANAIVEKSSADYGLTFTGAAKRPAGTTKKVSPLRIAIWDVYGGSIPSGWVRWIMEQYHFPARVIYSPEIDSGKLHDKYDVIVFVTGAIPGIGRLRESQQSGMNKMPKPEEIPAEWRSHLGRISADTSVPQIKAFLMAGGSVVTVGSSAKYALRR